MHWQEKLEKSAGEMGKKLRGAWKQKGDMNNTVCLLPGSWVPSP